MPAYQIHRLKETLRQQFRGAPHTSGVTVVKPKDYQKAEIIEASSPYAVWMALRDAADSLLVGDLLELDGGELRIFKYIGFEEARWYVPEPVPSSDSAPIEVT